MNKSLDDIVQKIRENKKPLTITKADNSKKPTNGVNGTAQGSRSRVRFRRWTRQNAPGRNRRNGFNRTERGGKMAFTGKPRKNLRDRRVIYFIYIIFQGYNNNNNNTNNAMLRKNGPTRLFITNLNTETTNSDLKVAII
jgi:hypothetical protein